MKKILWYLLAGTRFRVHVILRYTNLFCLGCIVRRISHGMGSDSADYEVHSGIEQGCQFFEIQSEITFGHYYLNN